LLKRPLPFPLVQGCFLEVECVNSKTFLTRLFVELLLFFLACDKTMEGVANEGDGCVSTTQVCHEVEQAVHLAHSHLLQLAQRDV